MASPQLNIVIAPKSSGKSDYILNCVGEAEGLVISQSAKAEDFLERFTNTLPLLRKKKVIEEENLDQEIEQNSYSNIHFTDLFAFVENAERHLDLFCSVAQFALATSSTVWGEISLGSSEVDKCREAVQALVKVAPSTSVSQVTLREGSGVLLQVDPAALLRAALTRYTQDEH